MISEKKKVNSRKTSNKNIISFKKKVKKSGRLLLLSLGRLLEKSPSLFKDIRLELTQANRT